MYSNLTFTTAGELFNQYGIVNYISGNSINLSAFDKLDELRISAVKFKLQSLLDNAKYDDIVFDVMPTEQRSMISQIYYGQKIMGVINMEVATAKKAMTGVRFDDCGEGYVAILHTMLRKALVETTPVELVLGQIHSVVTGFLYNTILRSFDKYYNILDKPEEDQAKIRYACAYVSACKMFKLTVPPDEVAIPLTQIMFKRVNSDEYSTGDDLSTYAAMTKYLSDTGVLENMNTGTLIEAFIRQLGYRSLVILECGMDFVLDTVLANAIGRIIPRNLFKLVQPKNCEMINRMIVQTINSGNTSTQTTLPAAYQQKDDYLDNLDDEFK